MSAAAHSDFPAEYGAPQDFATFARGWAYAPRAAAAVAHFYVERGGGESPLFGVHGRVKFFLALCGASAAATSRGPLFEAGKATRCRRCEALAGKGKA